MPELISRKTGPNPERKCAELVGKCGGICCVHGVIGVGWFVGWDVREILSSSDAGADFGGKKFETVEKWLLV